MLEGNAPSYQAYETCVLLLNYSTILVPEVGLEPTTHNFSGYCSTRLELLWHILGPREGLAPSTTIYETVILLVKLTRHIGCRGWIRTTDLQLMRLARTTGLLYSAINLVPTRRIERRYTDYKTVVIPLYDEG